MGLIAGKAANSFGYDTALGRTKYVFVGTASFRFNYGFGSGILIDPAVLDKPGVECSEQDIGDAIKCMQIWLEDSECIGLTRERVKRADILREIVTEYRAEHGSPEEGAEWDTAVRIAGSARFKQYYAEHYCVPVERLYQLIEQSAGQRHCSLFEYFNRTNMWPLTEEFLIPHQIEPDYLLGYWDGGAWQPWASPKSPGTDQRLQKWIDALTRR
jgi:hypothetical protein